MCNCSRNNSRCGPEHTGSMHRCGQCWHTQSKQPPKMDPEDPREPQSLQSVPRPHELESLPEPPSSHTPSYANKHVLEHGTPTAPEDDDPEDCAPERLSQYSDDEVQDLYQVTPDTSQQNGCPEPLHAYVSEHSLGMPEPSALGASQLPTMPGSPY